MNKHIHIEQIEQPCITRHRGHKAFFKLQKFLETETVEIDFRSCEIVSLSFLDELVTHISESFDLEKVIFIVPNRAIEDKLARIAGLRNVTILCCLGTENTHRVEPKFPAMEKASFIRNKALLY